MTLLATASSAAAASGIQEAKAIPSISLPTVQRVQLPESKSSGTVTSTLQPYDTRTAKNALIEYGHNRSLLSQTP